MLQTTRIVSTAEMKQAEENAVRSGLSYPRLMENAGSAAYRFIRDELGLERKRFVVLCGAGNNGGDGFVLARKLLEQECITTVICAGIPKTEDAGSMYEMLSAMEVEILTLGIDESDLLEDRLENCEVIVDAVFGTGFHGTLPENIAALFDLIRATSAQKVALDMPSGVNSDTGEADAHAFQADWTVSFAALKTGHILPGAQPYCGRVSAANIGIDDSCFEGMGFRLANLSLEAVQEILPVRRADSHKGSYGKLVNIAGSKNMSGAAMMSTLAALRSGAGLVTLASTDRVVDIAASRICEATYLRLGEDEAGEISSQNLREVVTALLHASACLIGCGMGCSENTERLLRTVLENSVSPVIIDADGINCLSHDINMIRTANVPVILTPHMGEMARLIKRPLSEIAADRFRIARDFASQWQVVLVLKDAVTVVACPDGTLYLNTAGNPGMARGGSGDVLAGMIASFAAQGIEPSLAAAAGVHLHAVCGDRTAEKRSQYGMLPSDMIEELPLLFQSMNR